MSNTTGSSSSSSSSESAVQDAVTAVLQHNFDAASKPCLLTILKLLDNILQKPHDPKYRTVKMTNAAVQSRIGNCQGGVEVLRACGFACDNNNSAATATATGTGTTNLLVLPEHSQPQQDFLVQVRRRVAQRCVHELGCRPEELPQYKSPPPPVHLLANSANSGAANNTTATTNAFNPYQGHRFDGLSAAVGANLGPDDAQWKSRTEAELERLQRQQQQLEAKLHHRRGEKNAMARDWTAARPGEALPVASSSTASAASSQSQQQPSDGALLAAMQKRRQAERLQREQGGFTTEAMRQVERLKKQKVYSHCTLQIQFPDGSKCCGKFSPSETVAAVQAALRSDCLNDDNNTEAAEFDLYVAPPRRLLPPTSKLQSEGLVPAAKLFVSWKVAPAPTDCLKPELFQKSPTAAAVVAFPEAHAIATAAGTTQSNKTDGGGGGDGEPGKKKKGSGSSNREEDLLKRMMGGGGKKSGGNAKKASGNNSGKPKWFKG